MRRRALLLLLGGAITGSRGLHAQQRTMPVVGFLSPGNAASPLNESFLTAFQKGLGETGYVEGQNLAIEYRWAENHYDRLPGLAASSTARLT